MTVTFAFNLLLSIVQDVPVGSLTGDRILELGVREDVSLMTGKGDKRPLCGQVRAGVSSSYLWTGWTTVGYSKQRYD